MSFFFCVQKKKRRASFSELFRDISIINDIRHSVNAIFHIFTKKFCTVLPDKRIQTFGRPIQKNRYRQTRKNTRAALFFHVFFNQNLTAAKQTDITRRNSCHKERRTEQTLHRTAFFVISLARSQVCCYAAARKSTLRAGRDSLKIKPRYAVLSVPRCFVLSIIPGSP